MFIVKLQGRLGNQLWQYAFGQYLTKTCGKKVVYDVSCVKHQSFRHFLLPKVLKSKVSTVDVSSPLWRKRIREFFTFQELQLFTFNKKLQGAENNTLFDGYFQHHKYLAPIETQLKDALLPLKIAKQFRTLKQTHALIALHIRRGDYVTNQRISGVHGNCSIAYYKQALEEMRKKVKNPYVLIFSDDIAWAEKNLSLDMPHEYVQSTESAKSTIADFNLMRFCDHFIIANSSFSWLAAWFGSTKNSQVITPYFFNFRHNAKTRQPSPPRWKPLPHNFVQTKPKTSQASIIIPVYNVQAYLARCLESVCNQSLEDIEIIVVNDCSPDNSEKIVLEYQQRDPRIVYIKHKKKLGLGGARNTGIRHAKSDWLLFVDSDDWIHKDMAKTMLEKAKQHKVKVVECGIMDASGQGGLASQYSLPIVEDTVIEDSFYHFCYQKMPYIFSMPWNKLWHRSLLIDNKVYFSKHAFRDYVAITPLLLYHAKKMLVMPKSYCFYFRGSIDNITNAQSSIKRLSHLSILRKRIISHMQAYTKNDLSIEKACTNHIQGIANFEFKRSMQYISQPEHKLFLKEYLKQYGEYGIHAITEGIHNKIQELSKNRWYKFGQLPKKEKIKFLLRFGGKKILQKAKASLRKILKI